MASTRPTYILAPHWDFLPTGPIQLGSLLTTPLSPQRSLNKTTLLPIPLSEITASNKTDWSITRSQLLSGHVGLWATFLAPILGLGAGGSVHGSHDSREVFKCARLETRYFQPDEKYIARSLQDPVVKAYTEKFWRKSVYMVTGVKIVYGGTVETSNGQGWGGEVKVSLDGTPAGVPVGGSPEVKGERSRRVEVRFGGSDDFVLGYQVIRIRKKGDGGFTEKDYNKWALLNDDSGVDAREEAGSFEESWDVGELATTSDEVGLKDMVVKHIADSDGEDCNVITSEGIAE